MGRISLVKDEVDHIQNGVEARLEFGAERHFERQAAVADLAFGAHQPLRDCGLISEKCARDFADAEAADGLEAERHCRIARDPGMAAHEDHAQFVVAKLLVEVGIGGDAGCRALKLGDSLLLLGGCEPAAADTIDRGIMRNAKEPGSGIFRDALVGPDLKRLQHGLLDGLLGEVKAGRSEEAGEMRDHPARLPAEEMLQKFWGGVAHEPQSWRISSVPPYSRCGCSMASATAWS